MATDLQGMPIRNWPVPELHDPRATPSLAQPVVQPPGVAWAVPTPARPNVAAAAPTARTPPSVFLVPTVIPLNFGINNITPNGYCSVCAELKLSTVVYFKLNYT